MRIWTLNSCSVVINLDTELVLPAEDQAKLVTLLFLGDPADP